MWDNSRQNEVPIFEIRQKLAKQEPILVLYFENDANPAAVVQYLNLNKKSEFWENSRLNGVQIVEIHPKIKG